MARRSLRPHLNQIRTWVRQGRTDAWIAHQLEVTGPEIAEFKTKNDLAAGSDDPQSVVAPEDVDLRAEDDAQMDAVREKQRIYASHAIRSEMLDTARRSCEQNPTVSPSSCLS